MYIVPLRGGTNVHVEYIHISTDRYKKSIGNLQFALLNAQPLLFLI